MTTIVLIKEGYSRDEWVKALDATGLKWKGYDALVRHFVVYDVQPADFPLKDHAAVELIEDDAPQQMAWSQTLYIPKGFGWGSDQWPLARHSKRNPPWGISGWKLPKSMVVNCARSGIDTDFYIVDSGVRRDHTDFGGRITTIFEVDGFVQSYNGDTVGHGTACASCAAGASSGFAKDALIFSAQCFTDSSSTSTQRIVDAMNACLSHYNNRASLNRPAVMNLSLRGFGFTSIQNAACADCISRGIVVVAAAGNDRLWLGDRDLSPGEIADVLLVGGTNMNDGPYDGGREGSGTNYGTEVDILGGSQELRFAYNRDPYGFGCGNGTSFGCPMVCGIILCMLQGHQRLTNRAQVQQVQIKLYNNATFGFYKPDPRFEPMTPAIAYLDPNISYEDIPSIPAK